MSATPAVELEHVSRIYSLPSGDVTALDDVTLSIERGEFVAIMGPSGSGKSTLLNQIGCLDLPTRGDLRLLGRSVRAMSDRELTDLRLSTIGFLFQRFNLIPVLTAYENVEFPYLIKNRRSDADGRVVTLLSLVGITGPLVNRVSTQLSGGEQQRVAIARALVNDPEIILCDEPTGNLDTKAGNQIMHLLEDLNQRGKTIVMVTHDPVMAHHAARIIDIRDGRIE
ncbi:MAG: ABC transporter ATP-binding protein [Methanomicrobiales archaeon]|nr:ABC transporter ATP-binding protein [Methanomicrobiales archaeon]